MAEVILQTHQLTKKYKKDFALENVSMTVNKGEIYGLIGKNGAGKSTLIRLVTGLAFPTSGSVELFGNSSQKHFTHALKRIGAMIEQPAIYPNMTAAENLEVQRLQKGIPGKDSIYEALEMVGLSHTLKKKVKNFSLGMKQRLGIAIALLSDPEFLILDEPTNGLDPMGIVEIRELIKTLNREKGITVLISSHILSELSQLATRFGIIHEGKMIKELSQQELNEACRQYIRIKADRPEMAATTIETSLKTTDFEVLHNGTIKLYRYLDDVFTVSKTLTEKGIVIEHLSLEGDDLETYFKKVIEGVHDA